MCIWLMCVLLFVYIAHGISHNSAQHAVSASFAYTRYSIAHTVQYSHVSNLFPANAISLSISLSTRCLSMCVCVYARLHLNQIADFKTQHSKNKPKTERKMNESLRIWFEKFNNAIIYKWIRSADNGNKSNGNELMISSEFGQLAMRNICNAKA